MVEYRHPLQQKTRNHPTLSNLQNAASQRSNEGWCHAAEGAYEVPFGSEMGPHAENMYAFLPTTGIVEILSRLSKEEA